MRQFIHEFMENNGVPIQRTSAECMYYLQNVMGYSFNVSRGILGRAVVMGFIKCTSNYKDTKTYN